MTWPKIFFLNLPFWHPQDHTGVAVKEEIQVKTPEQVQETKIDDAYENLLNVVGEIEFQMGVHSLMARNYANAASHFKQGSSHNHSGAIFNLGLCYEQGLGVKKDLNKVNTVTLFFLSPQFYQERKTNFS